MVRPTQHVRPGRTPAPLLSAATVLLVRDSTELSRPGIEVLMTRRSMSASFAPGAYVFPGGGIEPSDHNSHAHSTHRPQQSDTHLTQALAAIRESFEELGVLLARRADGHWVDDADIATLDRHAPLAVQCAARGWVLAGADVWVLAHWITDRDLPKRFDVPFLIARMPEHQTPVADEREQFEPQWVRPADALARHQAGDFFMIYPTVKTLERLGAHPNAQSLLDACALSDEPLWTSCPRAGRLGGRESRHMEHEAPFGELALVCPDGQVDHPLDWQSQHAVPLLRHVQRLSAPNPGVMTGPGTNSYIVGDPESGHVVIDPGPDEPEHIDRLWRLCGASLRAIVCTHSHPDHAPGAARLQALCAHRPPILGLSSAATARAHSRFTPDREWRDGETLVLSGHEHTHTLRAVHTPGHAANHLCVLIEEDGLLFSGDHILNGSTTVIDPPDGNMDDYLNSLDKLDALCARWGVHFILPAHGHVMGDWPRSADHPSSPEHGGARAAIAQLKAHRLAREAKVARAMAALPQGGPEDWVKLAYADVPERLWPVAMRSLLAHVQRIQSSHPSSP